MIDYLNHSFSEDDPELVSVIDELPLWSAPFGLKLLDTIHLRPKINALDIGCGLGFPLIEVAQRLGKSSQVFGIDPWERALERIILKIRKYNIKNVTPVKSVAESLPFHNNFFDLIVSNNGINNVQDIEQTLSECYRVSKPGAQFTFTVNSEETMAEFYNIFKETLIDNNLQGEVKKMQDQIYSKRKPLNETKSLLNNAGFRINSILEDRFQIRFIDGSTLFNHSLIKYWFLTGWSDILDPHKLEPIFEQVENRLNSIAKVEGEIALTIPYVVIDCRRK